MALETTNKKRINFKGFSLRSRLAEFRKQLQNRSNNEVKVSIAKMSNTLSEFKEKELTKFDSGFTAKVDMYTRRFY